MEHEEGKVEEKMPRDCRNTVFITGVWMRVRGREVVDGWIGYTSSLMGQIRFVFLLLLLLLPTFTSAYVSHLVEVAK